MAVLVERLIVVQLQVEAATMEEANSAFADLRARVEHSIPKRRFAPCTILARKVTLRTLDGREIQ